MTRRQHGALVIAIAVAPACSRANPLYEASGSGGAATDTGAGDGGPGDGPGDGGDATAGGTGDGADTSAGGSAGTGLPACEGEGFCFVAPDDTWDGPFAFQRLDSAQLSTDNCRDPSYPTQVRQAPSQASDPSEPCCQCGVDTPPACYAAILGIEVECGVDATATFEQVLDQCVLVGNVDSALNYVLISDTDKPTVCSATTAKLEPVIEKVGHVCGGAEPIGTCDGGECFPSPAQGPVCITHPGAVACPEPFTKSFEMFEAVGDYTCPKCVCDVASECDPTLWTYASGDCSSTGTSEPFTNECVASLPFDVNASIEVTFADAECTHADADVVPDGTYAKDKLLTVCCVP